MSNINNPRLFLRMFLLVVCVSVLVSACDTSLDKPIASEQDDMVLVRIDISDKSVRSILPVVPSMGDIAGLELYGTSSPDPDKEEIWLGGFEDLSAASVLLRPGRWNFTLWAYDEDGYYVLKGVKKNVDIAVGYTASVQFNLSPINVSDFPDDEGAFYFSIDLPEDADIARVDTYVDGDYIGDWSFEIEDNYFELWDWMTVGDYLVTLEFYDSEDRLRGVITEMLVIRSSLWSDYIVDLTNADFNSTPLAPTHFRATDYTDDNLTFNWNDNSHNETGFVLSDGTTDYQINSSLTSYVLQDADAMGKTFTLYAVNDFGESPEVTYTASLPAVPTGVVVTGLSTSSIGVSWTATNGALGYIIQRAATSDGTYTQVGTSTETETSFTDNTGLAPASTYYYKVIATNAFGNSSESSAASDSTLALAVPTGVTATTQSATSIRISWVKLSGAVSYKLYRSTSATGTYTLVTNLDDTTTVSPGSTIYWDNTGLSTSTTYYFKLSQVNADGYESGLSAYAFATTTVIAPGSEGNPYPLTAGIWTNGSITSSASGAALWYSFSVSSGTTYRIWWNDSYSGSGKTLDVKVDAYYPNGAAIFTGVDSGYNTAQSFTATSSGTVKIKVSPYSNGATGNFGVAYSTSATRPAIQ